jgi:hypothetical protein
LVVDLPIDFVAVVVLVGWVRDKVPYLMMETTSTATRGNQISAGFNGVTPGIVEMQATARK